MNDIYLLLWYVTALCVLYTILVKASGSEYKSLWYFNGAAAAAAAATIDY